MSELLWKNCLGFLLVENNTMEAGKILSADILDIIFDGRNKNYGAYVLRKSYNTRLAKALGFMFLVIFSAIGLLSLFNSNQPSVIVYNTPPLILEPTDPPPATAIPKPIAASIVASQKISNTKPLIVVDNKVTDQAVPTGDISDVIIDTKSGADGLANVDGPIDIHGSTILETLHVKEKEDSTYVDVQIPASFNGNWNLYVTRQVEKNMDELVAAAESGTCLVQFVVSTDGSVSNVEALTMKSSKLAEISIAAIRNGPKWKPAINNGHQVKAYRQQPVTFKLDE